MSSTVAQRFDHLTFRGNLAKSRHGWLRLTPAYSVHLVAQVLETADFQGRLLDPFCGTGTTALACAERGVAADTTDINPFLIWLTRAKTRRYTEADLRALARSAHAVCRATVRRGQNEWVPPLHQIDKWWPAATLHALGRALAAIGELSDEVSRATSDLLLLAFCRTLIEGASVSFGHQSMSFKKREGVALSVEPEATAARFLAAVQGLADSALSPIKKPPRALLCDARALGRLSARRYGCVLTSPPYPNRMSYIRELRPYMYWLGHLHGRRDAGALDWLAIGGTWGAATSNVARWEPERLLKVPFQGFRRLVSRIAEHSDLLARYVHKYFYDIQLHIEALSTVLEPGAPLHYIVGNSKFYDVVVPVERIYARLFAEAGFEHVNVRTLRKRTSKKELFEYLVSARRRG
jgi:hypothetical protein